MKSTRKGEKKGSQNNSGGSRSSRRSERREKRAKRRSLVRNVAIVAIAAAVVAAVISYNYSAELTKQKGLRFGMELEEIQDDVKALQTEFYSEKTKWEEGDLSREQLLVFYDGHIDRFEDVITKYDTLEPPEIFEGAVRLLKISSQSQLDSDSEYVEWIKNDDATAKARSDALLQDALEYELLGLVEFYSAKTGVKTFDDTGEKFEEPNRGIIQKVNQVAEHMIEECNSKFGQGKTTDAPPHNDSDVVEGVPGVIASENINSQWAACVSEAEEWRASHIP